MQSMRLESSLHCACERHQSLFRRRGRPQGHRRTGAADFHSGNKPGWRSKPHPEPVRGSCPRCLSRSRHSLLALCRRIIRPGRALGHAGACDQPDLRVDGMSAGAETGRRTLLHGSDHRRADDEESSRSAVELSRRPGNPSGRLCGSNGIWRRRLDLADGCRICCGDHSRSRLSGGYGLSRNQVVIGARRSRLTRSTAVRWVRLFSPNSLRPAPPRTTRHGSLFPAPAPG